MSKKYGQVKRYVKNSPIKTDIVVEVLEKHSMAELEILSHKETEECSILSLKMADEDFVWGLGENVRGLNKRGFVYESFCSDDPNHAEDKRSLYGAHNFFILDGEEKFGVYIDFAGKVTFDVGYSKSDELNISVLGKDFEVYLIKGEKLREITKTFLGLIGKSYLPPKWAFGYMQSRWSYPTGEAVLNIADNFVEKEIPCDGICLDLDYMDDFKDFSLSNERFPNFEKLTYDLKEKGVKIIPIIDAGVKIEKDYDIYEEGIKNDYFVKDIDGKNFVAAVWPGKVHFPDFLNSKARSWFGEKYKKLIDLGVEGFWNDMNEPAIFYSETGLENAFKKIDELKGQELNINGFFALKDAVLGISNSDDDYRAMHHDMDGEKVNHYDVHNLYGYNMTKAAAEGFEKIDENKRYLLFSRASSIGMHRYGGIWTGDNCSWWSHLKLNISMMPSLNMCGFIYSGADTGGFGSNADSELISRWNQFSIFAPLYRNHSALGTRSQEPFSYDIKTENIVKNAIKFRYAMIPYLYSEFMKARNASDMLIAPLAFEYDDSFAKSVEDQLLIGDSLMIAPVCEANKKGRYVYLPDKMALWKVKKYNDVSLEKVEKGHHYMDIALDEFAVFIRKNKLFILGKSAQSTEKLNMEELNLVGYVEDRATYKLYSDDGISKDMTGANEMTINVEIVNEDCKVEILKKVDELKIVNINIMTSTGKVIEKKIEF
ncbi:MAG: glycoside hydrolase family 31 protein [Sarcina sp.]